MEINEADVAELVDARDLKSLDGNVVRVRVPPPAPRFALRGYAWPSQRPRRSVPGGLRSSKSADGLIRSLRIVRPFPALHDVFEHVRSRLRVQAGVQLVL
jgi:hypothetical protein